MTAVPDRNANLVGAAWMVAAMAGFAVEDSFIKAAARSLPVGEVLILFGAGGALVFALLARLQGSALIVPEIRSRPMAVRVVFEVTGRLFYVLALALIPLSTATVILQATPLVVVAGAALVFGERVGWRRWMAIGVGLLGVVVIVQPGAEGVSLLSVLAVIGMVGFAGRDLASRAAPAALSAAVLGFYGFLSIILAGALYALWEGAAFALPGAEASAVMLGAVLSGVFAYGCLMRAMRTGDVSAVTPFRYTRMLFGIGLGVLVFGEGLSLPMVGGSALILLSGLFILWRGRAG